MQGIDITFMFSEMYVLYCRQNIQHLSMQSFKPEERKGAA
jgi:hypothetical protein